MESHQISSFDANVTVYVRVYRGKTRHYYPAVYANPYRLRERCGLVKGQPEFFEAATYVLRFTDPVRGRAWLVAGQDAEAALVAKRRKELELEGLALGIPMPPMPNLVSRSQSARPPERFEDGRKAVDPTSRVRICAALDVFLDDAKRRNSKKTDSVYRNHLRLFLSSFTSTPPKIYLDEVSREDILGMQTYSKGQGHSARTTYNAWRTVRTFLRSVELSHLIRRGDAPRYTKKAAAAYSVNDLSRLFTVCSPEEKLLFEFFLGSGAREGEVTHACWFDINFDAGLFTIRAKPDLGWTLKDREERSVPLPDALLTKLEQRRAERLGDRFLFPTSTGKPNGHFLGHSSRLR